MDSVTQFSLTTIQEEDSACFPPSSWLAAANLASRSRSTFSPYSVKTPSFEVMRIGPPWFLRPSPGVRSIFSRCGGSFWWAAAQARTSSTGLLLREFEADKLSGREDDVSLLGVGEAIDDDVIGVAVVGGCSAGRKEVSPNIT
jgi:hypothetical protein